MTTWIKVGAILAAVILVFGAGFYLGGLRSKASLEALQAASAANVAKAVLAQKAAGDAETSRLQGVIDAYDKSKDDLTPVAVGLAHRVYVYETAPSSCVVSKATAGASGTPPAAAEPRNDPAAERIIVANQNVYDACEADAKQLVALEEWVRGL